MDLAAGKINFWYALGGRYSDLLAGDTVVVQKLRINDTAYLWYGF
jgi:hypothetical protein